MSPTPTLDAELGSLHPKLGRNAKLIAEFKRIKSERARALKALEALVERYGPSFGYSGDQRDELANAEMLLVEAAKP